MIRQAGWSYHCDRCGNKTEVRATETEARAQAFWEGWRHVEPEGSDHYDLCVGCACFVSGAPSKPRRDPLEK